MAKNGKLYRSPLEERLAALFDKNGLEYDSLVNFPVNNGSKTREVDFVLRIPVVFKGYEKRLVKNVEVKSEVSQNSIEQHDELRDAGIYTHLVTEREIIFWKENGLLAEGEKKRLADLYYGDKRSL